jgi:hypothetical protein
MVVAKLVPLTLRKLPLEIRDMIYELIVGTDSWNGKTPSLILALRGDQELYKEALRDFYDNNTFAFTKRHRWLCMVGSMTGKGEFKMNWKFGEISRTALKIIKHVSITFPFFLKAYVSSYTSTCGRANK